MKGSLLKTLAVLSCLAMIGSGVGVQATWYYTQNVAPNDAEGEFTTGITTWVYLPGAEGDDTVEIGENHNTLIEEILNHEKQGMNFSDFIFNAIDSNKGDKNMVHSQQNNVPGGTPKKFFSSTEYNTQYLDFIVQRILNAEVESYYIYTYEDDDLVGTKGQSWVPAYQTLVKAVDVVNGRTKFAESGVKKGRALLYSPKGYSFLSIDPTTWEQTF